MALSPLKDFDDIIGVDLAKTDGVYEVRVLKKWLNPDHSNPGSFSGVDMVLVDEKGHKIQATVPNSVLSIFEDLFVEGEVYIMSNLSVSFNFGSILPTYHRHKFEFKEDTVVLPSFNSLIPVFGLSLITAEDVLMKRQRFPYLVDVIGVLTTAVHDKKKFPDEKVTQSVTCKLNHQKRGFNCELSGEYVEEFSSQVKSCSDGLPVIVLQFVQLSMSQGRKLVTSVDGVTKLFVEPSIPEVESFKDGMANFLAKGIEYSSLFRRSRRTSVSRTLDFLKDYPFRTLDELKNNPELGLFIVNARICDILSFHPWWYPMCDCAKIFENYIGDFRCDKCGLSKFKAGPKVKFTLEVDDDFGNAIFNCFDHVMKSVVECNMATKGISANFFYKAFGGVLGKSIMFIVRKTAHDPEFCKSNFEVLSISDHVSVIEHFIENGHHIVPCKEFVKKRNGPDAKQKKVLNSVPCITTTKALIDEYLSASSHNLVNADIASSSGLKRPRV